MPEDAVVKQIIQLMISDKHFACAIVDNWNEAMMDWILDSQLSLSKGDGELDNIIVGIMSNLIEPEEIAIKVQTLANGWFDFQLQNRCMDSLSSSEYYLICEYISSKYALQNMTILDGYVNVQYVYKYHPRVFRIPTDVIELAKIESIFLEPIKSQIHLQINKCSDLKALHNIEKLLKNKGGLV